MAVTITLTNLEGLFARGLEGTAQAFAEACDDAFDDPVWDWPHRTHRRNGQTVGSPRNIVDSGELRASRQPPQILGHTARLTWDADHAAAVYLGAVFRNRAASLPARNLPQYVAQDFNFADVFLRRAGLR